MASGSRDRTIKVWNLISNKLKQTLEGHTKGVWCLKFLTKYLLCSGSYDCTIRIWNLKDSICSRILISHTGPIWSMVKSGDLLITASQDRTAKIWDLSNCEVLKTLSSHKGAIFCVDVYSNIIVTGSADKHIKLWNKRNGEILKSLNLEKYDQVSSVSIYENYLTCSCKQTILVWKIDFLNDMQLVQEYKEHYKKIECVKLITTNWINNEVLFVSVGQDGLIKYWNLKNSKSVHTFDVHRSKPINSVYFDEFRIVSASNDKTLKILDFN